MTRSWCLAPIARASGVGDARQRGIRTLEHVSDHGARVTDASGARSPSAEWLDVFRGFRVEWDDGSVGVAGGIAIFVRTAGLGSGHSKFELVTGDDVVAILPEERRILVRTRVPPAVAIGRAVRRVLARRLGRLVAHAGALSLP
jgi:hypothetical protein